MIVKRLYASDGCLGSGLYDSFKVNDPAGGQLYLYNT